MNYFYDIPVYRIDEKKYYSELQIKGTGTINFSSTILSKDRMDIKVTKQKTPHNEE